MNTLSMFDEPDEAPRSASEPPKPMYDSQRSEIRGLFAQIGLTTAREQFALVEEMIGIRMSSVTDLTAVDAQRLILQLRGRAASHGRARTGNAWADRDEDTWIDKL